MSGFGTQPAGTSSAGFGVPEPATVQGGVLLRDAQTGATFGARKIDIKARDYVLDSDAGRLLGMNDVQQIVQLCIGTELGSSAVKQLGQELRKLDRVTANFQARCLNTLTNALRSPIDLGLVAVLGFTTFKAGPKDGLQPGQTYGRLKWRDLTTGAEHLETI